jgi:hypothetical protein
MAIMHYSVYTQLSCVSADIPGDEKPDYNYMSFARHTGSCLKS